MNKKTEPLINLLDADTHDNIIRLQQKLKGLKTEISVKLESFTKEHEEYKYLQQLAEEVDIAIQQIENLMNRPITDDEADTIYNNVPMEEFSKKIANRVKEISRLKEKF
ncbi:hypothetical protein FOG18_00160 [Legionella israelensis]|uniref:hypothetical protein n=1 Tax=Legionella israelensis TaxID=454 RepID=UPI0011808E5A|nr:hypothetical protein [Legionella israelensis]QDP71111.1 hypothetical protein FOG18_00160 [Legionella israelensis]